jgi:tetratricopeptide (TPR) repeat protein
MKLARGIQFTATVCMILVLGGVSGTVSGADDGGGRSILSYGAGNRPLALGGAYVAIADDASAALWNPGGLGFIARKQFQATHTNLIGFGFSEQYASFVWPSWRWGVASLTYRRFGVDGIEQRDDRNVLLNDDLNDSETELDLAYGRALGAGWSVGGVLKMRRQYLAGFSDTGFGLDLGLLVRPLVTAGSNVPWAKNLAFGIAVRNLIEPVIRLDQENVPDPTGLRIGMSYKYELGSLGNLLGDIDLEKTRNMDSRFHAGLEWQIHPVLALRAGMNHGTFTAGTGIEWKDIGVSYMFENIPNGNLHSVGVSFTFGPTVEEDRRSALAAEEDSLQARLSQEFAKRSRQRIMSFMHQAETALENDEFEKALEIMTMVKVLDPDLVQAQALEARILREQGLVQERNGDYMTAAMTFSQSLNLNPDDQATIQGLDRVRGEIERLEAHSVAVQKALDSALNALAAGKLLVAREGFRNVLAIDPDDAETKALLAQTDKAIRDRAAAMVEHGRALVKAGQYDQAWATLQQARELDPESPDLNNAFSFLASSRLARTAAEKEARREASRIDTTRTTTVAGRTGTTGTSTSGSETVMSEEKQREVEDLYRRGMTAMENGKVDDALHYWELVWLTDPQYQRVTQYLKQEYLTRGMEAFVAGDLYAAINDWEKAVRVDPDDERARGYLERAQQQLSVMQNISTSGSD